MEEGKAETSSHTHTKEAAIANTANPENNLKTAKQITCIW